MGPAQQEEGLNLLCGVFQVQFWPLGWLGSPALQQSTWSLAHSVLGPSTQWKCVTPSQLRNYRSVSSKGQQCSAQWALWALSSECTRYMSITKCMQPSVSWITSTTTEVNVFLVSIWPSVWLPQLSMCAPWLLETRGLGQTEWGKYWMGRKQDPETQKTGIDVNTISNDSWVQSQDKPLGTTNRKKNWRWRRVGTI